MKKKYELTENTKEYDGHTLYQIKALRDIIHPNFNYHVKKGDLGGWIESEANLSQEGNCWIYGDSMVYDDSRLYDEALVIDSIISFDCKLYEHVIIHNSKLHNNVVMNGNINVYNCEFSSYAYIAGRFTINDSIIQCPFILYNVNYDSGPYEFYNMDLRSERDYLIIKGLGSINRPTVVYRTKKNSYEKEILHISCGCFHGTLDEFKAKVKDIYEDKDNREYIYYKEYSLLADLIDVHLRLM